MLWGHTVNVLYRTKSLKSPNDPTDSEQEKKKQRWPSVWAHHQVKQGEHHRHKIQEEFGDVKGRKWSIKFQNYRLVSMFLPSSLLLIGFTTAANSWGDVTWPSLGVISQCRRFGNTDLISNKVLCVRKFHKYSWIIQQVSVGVDWVVRTV